MSSFYDGKVLCPDCDGECVVHYDHTNHLGEVVDWPEQCWRCGASGWVRRESLTNEEWLIATCQGGMACNGLGADHG